MLELMNGQKLKGVLACPFRPEKNQVDVFLNDDSQPQTLSMDKICCVMMKSSRQLPMNGGVPEIVETFGGHRYRVIPFEGRRYQTGFFGFLIETNTLYPMVFFTDLGVKRRFRQDLVGEILEKKGHLSQSNLDTAIEEQQKLRKRRLGEIISENIDVSQSVIDQTIEKSRFSEEDVSFRPSKKPLRVGQVLIEAGLVTREQVKEALSLQGKGKKKKIGYLLIELGYITEQQLLSALATKFHMNLINLEDVVPTQEILSAISMDLIRRLQIFPVEIIGDHLVVATSDPADPTVANAIRFHTDRRIRTVVASSGQISAMIDRFYTKPKTESLVRDLLGTMTKEEVIATQEEEPDLLYDEPDSQIVTLVNNILIDAYKKGASDIHFETGFPSKPALVRYRIDGICQIVHKIPPTQKIAVISRIKIISGLDIAERRKPQSGKIMLRFGKEKIEYRVETMATVEGCEDAVLRILSSSKPLRLEKMGFSPTNLEPFKEMLGKPYGIILCVGPTGSGKTTTLHSAIAHINTPERKILTVEDPVEITQKGLRQVQVNAQIGLTFQHALRSFLRADPDVVMIGEMRDTETAKTAIEASLTGHLVFSTLHTNSAPETVTRLIEMGMDPFNFSDAILGVLAQRLVRRLCERCKAAYHPDMAEYQELARAYGEEWFKANEMPPYSDDLKLMRKTGCEVCGGSGYKGRVAIHELLAGTEAVKTAIKRNMPLDEFKMLALHEKMTTLRMDGIFKVFQGVTDISEVMRVCI